jgi:hypothetical protein
VRFCRIALGLGKVRCFALEGSGMGRVIAQTSKNGLERWNSKSNDNQIWRIATKVEGRVLCGIYSYLRPGFASISLFARCSHKLTSVEALGTSIKQLIQSARSIVSGLFVLDSTESGNLGANHLLVRNQAVGM